MAETTTTEKKPVTKAEAKPKAVKRAYTHAVIMTGGKQYLVTPGLRLKIEKLLGAHKEGDAITFDNVLFALNAEDVSVGTPYVSGLSVKATIVKIGRYKTIDVIKYKQKSRYFKKNGHRQPYFEVKIDSIS